MIDSHFHLEEELVSLSGIIASMDAAGIERTALIPSLVPPFFLPGWLALGLPVLRRSLHREEGLVHTFGLAIYRSLVKKDGTVKMGNKRYRVKAQPDNDEVLSALARYPDRFRGWIFINPAGPVDAVAEIERCLKSPGLIGVKAHPYWHDYPVSLLKDAAAFCAEKGLPILIHLGTGENGDFRVLPEAFPSLRTIYAHAGIPYSFAACDYAGEKKNVFVDLSSSAYVDLAIAKQAVRRAGAAKCLFGSDGPYFHHADDRFDYQSAVKLIQGLGLSKEDRGRVESKNFEEVISG